MKINTVSENRIDIFLSDEEIDEIFGGYELIDYDAPDCRIKIHNLLAAAIPEGLLPLNCERVLIEVKPRNRGCTITFTKIYTGAKRFRAVKGVKTVVFVFENSDSLIRALGPLKGLNTAASELYVNNESYAIIATVKIERIDFILHIGEYCQINTNEFFAVKIREYWMPVCTTNAINKLADAFLTED